MPDAIDLFHLIDRVTKKRCFYYGNSIYFEYLGTELKAPLPRRIRIFVFVTYKIIIIIIIDNIFRYIIIRRPN